MIQINEVQLRRCFKTMVRGTVCEVLYDPNNDTNEVKERRPKLAWFTGPIN